MIIEDRIYGRFEITEPVLIDLINTPTVTRLKGISTRGYPEFVDSEVRNNYSRYEHSVGCMLLLRMLGAGIEEQIAGLLHDVSHSAFSHIIDWVFGDPEVQSHQDSILKDYINKSEIPTILQKYGIDASKISCLEESESFGLLERKIPGLCADRLDYSLRDMKYTFKIDVKYFIDNLTVHNNRIVFKSYKPAHEYALAYARCHKHIWAEPSNILRYVVISEFLKKALASKVISYDDFYKDEKQLIEIINTNAEGSLKEEMSRAFGKLHFKQEANGNIRLKTKFRYVDPEFLDNGKVQKVTDVNKDYEKSVKLEAEISSKGFTVSLLND